MFKTPYILSLLFFSFFYVKNLSSQCVASAGPDVVLCAGSSVNLGGMPSATGPNGPFTYNWSPAVGLSCTDCPNPISTTTQTRTYTLTVYNSDSSCVNTDQVVVTFSPLPIASFTITGANQCASIPVLFTGATTGIGNVFNWNFGDPASGADNTAVGPLVGHQFNAFGSSSQTFNVTLTVTNTQGCTSLPVNQNVTVNQTPGAALEDPIWGFRNCEGSVFDMLVFDVSTVNPASNYQIIWGDGTPNFSGTTFPGGGLTHSYTTQEVFDLVYIVTGSNGCSDTLFQTVTNITNPAIGAANPGSTQGCGPLEICFPLTNFNINHPSTIYIIDYGDGTPIDTLQHPPPSTLCHTYTQSSCPGSYTFIASAENMCDVSSATITPIRVSLPPQASFTPTPNPACVGIPITFLNTSMPGFTSNCGSFATYTWDFGDGSPIVTQNGSVPQNQVHTYNAPGTYTVTLTASNVTCGSTTSTQIICVEEPPIPAFTLSSLTGCIPFNTTADNTTTTLNTCQLTYNWTVFFNGSTCQPSAGTWQFAGGTSASSFEPQFQFLSPGEYLVRLTVSNSCGVFTFDQTVTAQGPPIVSLNPITSICSGQTATPTAVVNDCYELANSYAWTFQNGTPATSSSLVPGSVTFNSAGDKTITLTVTNNCGSNNASTLLTVNNLPTGASPTANTPLCEGGTIQLNAIDIPGATYTWSGPNGFSSGLQNPQIMNVTSANAGIYSVFATAGVCQGPTQTVNVTINAAPTVTAPVDFSRCLNAASVNLVGTPVGGSWSGTGVTGNSFSPSNAGVGSHVLTYTFTNATGCSNTATVTATVNPLPIVNAGPDLSVCNQPIPVNLSGTPAGGTWTGTGITDPLGEFTPSTLGNFNAIYTITDGNGCVGRDTLVISVINATAGNAGPDSTVCLNAPLVQLNGLPAGGSWTGTGLVGNSFNPNITGSFELVYSFGSGSCATTDTLEINVNPLPTINPLSDITTCSNGSIVNLTATPAGGSWSGNGVVGNTFNPALASIGSQTLTYTFTSPATGCSNTATLIATVNSTTLVDAGPDLFLCNQPIPEVLTGTPAGGTWTGTGITNPSGEFTPNGIGTFEIVYAFSNASGCPASDTIIITVGDPSNANAGVDIAVCIDAANIQLNGLPAGGTWTGSGVTSSGVFDPTVAGTFEMVYSVGSGTCVARDTMEITVNPLPLVDAGLNSVFCLDAAPQTLTGTPAGGTWSGIGITNPFGTFNPSVAGTGSHTLTYSYINPLNGCQNTDTRIIDINPLPTPNAGNDTILCNQAIGVQFTGLPSGGSWTGTSMSPTGVFTPTGTGVFTAYYTFVLGTGCSATDSVQISIVDATQADAGIDREICIGDPNFLIPSVLVGGSWTGAFVSSNGEFTPSTVGNYELVYSVGAGNCLTRDTMNFIVQPLPVVSVGPDLSFCISAAAESLNSNVTGGTWTGTGITNASLGTFNPAIAGVGSHQIVYVYQDPISTCENSDTLIVTVNPLPQVSFTYNPIMCVGTAETFTNTSDIGTGFEWDFGDGFSSSTENPNHTYLQTGFFDVLLIVTSVNGCVDSLTQSLEVREPPTAAFTLAPDSSCAPLVTSFTNNSVGINPTFGWDFGNGQSSIDQNPNPVTFLAGYLADTTYYITLSVTNFCGTVTATDSVKVMPVPVAIFGPLFDVGCSPYTATFANNSVGLPDSYFWDFGDGTTSTDPNALVDHVFTTGQEPTQYTITLTVTNECGTSTAQHTITVLPNQVNAFFNTPSTSGCEPFTITFTQFSTGANTFVWDFGDGNTSNIFSPTHTFTNAGTYTVTLAINDGCSYDTSSVVINVSPSPFVDFTSTPDSVCINVPFDFTNLSQGLAGSVWSFGDGSTSNLTNPSHAFGSSGIYNVTLTGTSAINGCTSTITKPVYVSPNPVASFTAVPISGCMPLNVQFTNTSTNDDYIVWDFNDGNSSTTQNPNHTFTEAGTYAVELLVENTSGCKDSVSQVITVHPLPVASFTLSTTDVCYAPVTATFTNESTGAVNYNWNFGNGQFSSLTNPTMVYTNPGTYTITLVAENQYGCTDQTDLTFTVYPTPLAQFVISDNQVCVGDSVVFTSQSSFADSLVWYLGDGTIAYGNQVTYAYGINGVYDVTLIIFGQGGCSDTLEFPNGVEVFPTPIAGFDYVNIQNPDPLSGTVEFTNTSINADTYLWLFGNGNTSTEVNPIERYNQYGEFQATLIASNQYGCVDSLTQIVLVDFFSGLFVPNAVYPGHPAFGVNHFLPKGVGLKTYEMLIYEDWGNLIFQTTSIDADGRPNEAWDATFNGEPVQQDAYVWKVTATFLDTRAWEGKEYANGIFKKSGTVTVIR